MLKIEIFEDKILLCLQFLYLIHFSNYKIVILVKYQIKCSFHLFIYLFISFWWRPKDLRNEILHWRRLLM